MLYRRRRRRRRNKHLLWNTNFIGLLAISGTKGLFCSGRELLTWLLPSPFDKLLLLLLLLLLLFRWLPSGFRDEDREEDELLDWYEGFIKLSLSGGVSRRVGGTMGARLCFTFTFLPMSVWFGFISLVLKNQINCTYVFSFSSSSLITIYFCDSLQPPSFDVWWPHTHHHLHVSAFYME